MRIKLRRALLLPWLRKPVRRWTRRPFGRLVSHFLQKLVRGGHDDASSELDLGAGALLGLLATPGAFASMLMLDRYSAFLNWMRGRLGDDLFVTSVPDKYLFICVAMAVTGIVTVLKWDQILPDQQDYLNLAPLPIGSRRILLANAAAIFVAVLVVALDVSVIPAVFFPAFVTAAARATFVDFAAFALVHALVLILASFFSIMSVFAILGTLSSVLPRETFRAVSPWLRGFMLLILLALLTAGFTGAPMVRYLPPMWFLGLYQTLQHRPTPFFTAVAPFALWGLAAAFATVVLTYGLSYRRRFAAVLEGGPKPSDQPFLRAVLRLLDLFAPRASGFHRAAHQFVIRAMLRSETHRMAIAVAAGLGWMAGSSLAAAYLLILGLRVAFDLPAGVRANWIFRATVDQQRNDTAAVARRAMLAFLSTAVLIPGLAVAWWQSGVVYAVGHTLYVLALSLILMEVLLAGYRKLPVTCPMPGFKDNFLMLCLIQFLGFLLFTVAGAAIERWMWLAPWRFHFIPLTMLAAWQWNRRRLAEAREAGELEEGLVFENPAIRTVTRLDLT
jgi:hypothetical protein